MVPPLDPYRISREELIDVVVWQWEQLCALEEEQSRLRAELSTLQATTLHLSQHIGMLQVEDDPGTRGGAHSQTMPRLKSAARHPKPTGARPPYKPRRRGYG